ncbi:MAG: Crp/Fnr family transcriptional regulator [Bacillota bacterium]
METNRRLCMRDLPFFDRVEQEVFSLVCRRAAVRKYYRRGEAMFSQGDSCDTVYLIKEGSFKLVRVTEDGKEVILQVAGKGEILGDASLFREGFQPATAVALEDARVCAVGRRRLEELVRETPDLALQIIVSLGNRLYDTWDQMTDLNAGTTRERVLNMLLRLAGEHGEPCEGGTIIRVHLTQQDIADFVGASRVMVAHALKELAARNSIAKSNRYYIIKDRCPLARDVKM